MRDEQSNCFGRKSICFIIRPNFTAWLAQSVEYVILRVSAGSMDLSKSSQAKTPVKSYFLEDQ